ncbi:malto-oligosyltrehalose synthase [uncultured Pseudacidovorax sp.]|uniref:malto-oligosyltrehalose synthase n=1 Tax=uncultured Pseudacidovorax sp. TaxID=679313 RepID=UPI0025D6726F|nr:malto-oligosyltrehalose synthase [uncultured Pseudacidovorax sp.]
MLDALYRACARSGLATRYHDVWGREVTVEPRHLASLLAELGMGRHAPEDGAAWQAEIDRLDDAEWREPLPPVLLAQADALRLPLTLRWPEGETTPSWTLRLEEGGAHEGQVEFAQGEGARRHVDGRTQVERRVVLDLPEALPMGYHRLKVGTAEALVIAAPSSCQPPPGDAEGQRHWGVAAQLYGLRSAGQWGMGDFADLGRLVEQAAALGAQAVGLNPLHALFLDDPGQCSPYSPSSRLFLNPLYIAVEALPEYADCLPARRLVESAEFQARLAQLRDSDRVDHVGVAAAKLEVLALLHEHVRSQRESAEPGLVARQRAKAFDDFRTERGTALQRHATFEALRRHLRARDPDCWGPPCWPEALRDAASPEVQAFAREHAAQVEFQAWLQWLAASQLDAAARQCRSRGMAIGLYLDLAVSVDRHGADAWAGGELFAPRASVGAPPDALNQLGQDWGLPPMRPAAMRRTGYGLFIDALRAGMRNAGAVRIDHVMGLSRLFWIPPGEHAASGAYVAYPAEEMMAIVALESRRQRCVVIGEDLGTVSDETRALMQRYGLLSYRLMVFEREGAAFKPPAAYPSQALAAFSTHDLATLEGWWAGTDLQERIRLQLYPSDEMARQQLAERAGDRVQLAFALEDAGALDAEAGARLLGSGDVGTRAAAAVYGWLAQAPSRLLMVQAEDLLGEREQANLPGTVNEHPNWRRRLALPVDRWAQDGRVAAIAAAVAAQRPAAAGAGEAGGPVRHPLRLPRATYRLQFHAGFTFDDAIAILPYLQRLGISHVYCSPIQRARPGSTHGYDVVAHGEINPELGGEAGFMRFCAALQRHGMGQIVDLVPNHMGVLGGDNPWWEDVLENGPASVYASHFDIEWQPPDPELAGKVLLPVLGGAYGQVLDDGELKLGMDAATGRLAIHYHDHCFPVAPESHAEVLRSAEPLVAGPEEAAALSGLAQAFEALPAGPDAQPRRDRDRAAAQARLAALIGDSAAFGAALQAAVARWNHPRWRERLHALLEAQHYRLAFWRVASDEINYRRFFDVNELAALRMERPEVFEATHGLALDLAARGLVDGLRIDHPDGLLDPDTYFHQLQQGYARRTGRRLAADDGTGRPERPLYVVAEKIAAGHEDVPESWAVHGTTGYRFANVAAGVLVDTDAEAAFERIWRGFTGEDESFHEVEYQGKRAVTRNALASDLTMIAAAALRIARADRRTRDYTLNNLRRALAEVATCMRVYRSYVTARGISVQDRYYIDDAIATARWRGELADDSIYDFVGELLRGELHADGDAALHAQVIRLAARFQQFSAPVAAKGVEDTAFYRWFPLASLNEVGGDPATFGFTLAQFHEASADRARRWPHTLLASSTHDNKRAEDVRMRLHVLSEMPAAWRLALRRWHALAAPLIEAAEKAHGEAPSRADEYLIYQSLLGIWPAGGADAAARKDIAERLVRYMHKAAREGKRHTSWVTPNEAYEAALADFVKALVEDAAFRADFEPQAERMAWWGALNSLVFTALKFCSAGVPDTYQGTEWLDFSLVDPDNRRPVDYEARSETLARLEAVAARPERIADGLAERMTPARIGEAKLWTAWRLLQMRRDHAALMRDGDHQPLSAAGPAADAVVGFTRQAGDDAMVFVAARFFARQDADRRDGPPPAQWRAAPWAGTHVDLPARAGGWREVLSGRVLPGGAVDLEALLQSLPIAVLVPAEHAA